MWSAVLHSITGVTSMRWKWSPTARVSTRRVSVCAFRPVVPLLGIGGGATGDFELQPEQTATLVLRAFPRGSECRLRLCRMKKYKSCSGGRSNTGSAGYANVLTWGDGEIVNRSALVLKLMTFEALPGRLSRHRHAA